MNVRGGTETLVSFTTTRSLHAYRAHRDWRFGFGLEGGFSLLGGDKTAPEIRLLVRANYAVSRQVELHADARVGVFGSMVLDTKIQTREQYVNGGTPGLLLGGDVQLNLGSVYTMSIGVDVGALIEGGPVAGAHVSPVGLRLGDERAALVALQAGVRNGSDSATFSFLLGVTYLFL